MPILPSSGPTDSAHLVYAVAKRCQVGKGHARVEQAAHGPPVGRRRATQSEQQLHILLALPGIGHVTARAVCARFRSLHDLLNADAAQLATVPGVGPLRAAATSTATACCLANLTRCAHIKKCRRRTNAGYLQHTGARTHITSGERLHPFCCRPRRADRTAASSHKREHPERRAGDVDDQQRQHFLHHATSRA